MEARLGLRTTMAEVAVSIVSHPSGDPDYHARLLDQCVASVRCAARRHSCRFVLTNNLAEVDLFGRMSELRGDEELLTSMVPVGFAANHNRAARQVEEEYLFVLNDDTLALDDAVDRLVDGLIKDPQAAIVGPAVFSDVEGKNQEPTAGTRILTPERALIWQVMRETPLIGKPWLRGIYSELSIPSGPCSVLHLQGAALLTRRSAYLEADGMDEAYGMYREETDLCLALGKRGWRILYEPGARIVHLGGQSTTAGVYRAQYLRSLDRFLLKQFGWRAKVVSRCFLPPALASVRLLRRLTRSTSTDQSSAG